MGCSVNGGGVSLGSEFGSIGYLNYCDGMRGRSVIIISIIKFLNNIILCVIMNSMC